MLIQLGVVQNEPNELIKQMYSANSLQGTLKGESPLMDPIIIIEHDNPAGYNYCHIAQFNRYYFVTEIVSVRNRIWELHLHVDVLMSFANYIRASYAIVSESSNADISNYISNDVWVATVKDKTDVLPFPQGFLEHGQYILITAGGIAT